MRVIYLSRSQCYNMINRLVLGSTFCNYFCAFTDLYITLNSRQTAAAVESTRNFQSRKSSELAWKKAIRTEKAFYLPRDVGHRSISMRWTLPQDR